LVRKSSGRLQPAHAVGRLSSAVDDDPGMKVRSLGLDFSRRKPHKPFQVWHHDIEQYDVAFGARADFSASRRWRAVSTSKYSATARFRSFKLVSGVCAPTRIRADSNSTPTQ